MEEFDEFRVVLEAMKCSVEYAGCGSHKLELTLQMEIRDLRTLKAQINKILEGDK